VSLSLALSAARTELIYLAALDGQTASDGRHTTDRLNALLNRKYRALRSRVSQAGFPQFTVTGSAAALPGRTSGEDYIEVPMAAGTGEVCQVHVNQGDEWGPLDPIGLEQWRSANTMCPPRGVGFWSVLLAPAPSTTSITAGKLALWPYSMTGTYKISTVASWTDITTDSHVFLLYDGWDDWLLTAAALQLVPRDSNKKSNYSMLKDQFAAADELIDKQSKRLQRGGHTSPIPWGGIEL
jgi:hypothetical protein